MYNTQDHIHNRTQMRGEIGRTHSKQKKSRQVIPELHRTHEHTWHGAGTLTVPGQL